MYLVDTSVWVDFLIGRELPHVRFLDELLANPLATGLTDIVYMEILQGARDQSAFDRLTAYFAGQRFYGFQESLQSHGRAARMYFDCRRKGITVRSALDCLIAQCALENSLILLHHDRDFANIANVVPALRQKHFLGPFP